MRLVISVYGNCVLLPYILVYALIPLPKHYKYSEAWVAIPGVHFVPHTDTLPKYLYFSNSDFAFDLAKVKTLRTCKHLQDPVHTATTPGMEYPFETAHTLAIWGKVEQLGANAPTSSLNHAQSIGSAIDE